MNTTNEEQIAMGIKLMHQIDTEKIRESAEEIHNWIQDAVGDMANDYSYLCMDSKWSVKIEHAKKDGVIDLKGWLADAYYNDVPTLEDLCGDRIHDAATTILGKYKQPYHDMIFCLICLEMSQRAHPALIRALARMDKRHKWSIKLWRKTTRKPIS